MAADTHIHLDLLLKQSGKHDYDNAIMRLPDAEADLPGYVKLTFGKEVHKSDRLILEYKNYVYTDLMKRNVALKAVMFINYKCTCIPQNLCYKSDTYTMHQRQPEPILPEMPPRTNAVSSEDEK